MTILTTLYSYKGRIGSIFITGTFGNFYTKCGGIFDFQNGNCRWPRYTVIVKVIITELDGSH